MAWVLVSRESRARTLPESMRILMLAHRIPYPPHTGDKIRAYQVARHLARNHELTLGFVIDDSTDHPGLDALRRDIPDLEWGGLWKPAALARGLTGLGLGRSLSIAYFRSGRLARRSHVTGMPHRGAR